MKTIIEYIDDLKEKTGSDNKSAKAIGIERSTIANIRRRNLISDETAIKIAEELGIDESEVLIAAAVARSDGKVLSAWLKISKAVGAAASFFILIQSVNYVLWGLELQKMHIMLN